MRLQQGTGFSVPSGTHSGFKGPEDAYVVFSERKRNREARFLFALKESVLRASVFHDERRVKLCLS